MKKLLIIAAFIAIAATKASAYSGYLYNDVPYQTSKTYQNTFSFLSYTLTVNKGGACISSSIGAKSIHSYTGYLTESGSFSRSSAYRTVYMSAAVLPPGGWGQVSATWY